MVTREANDSKIEVRMSERFKERVERYWRSHNYENASAFIRYCVEQEMDPEQAFERFAHMFIRAVRKDTEVRVELIKLLDDPEVRKELRKAITGEPQPLI